MFINPLPPSFFQAALKAFGPEEPGVIFQQGDIVEGTVVRSISGKQAIVRLGGVEMVALTPSRLYAGQSIVGRVERVTPNITVSLLRGESSKEVKTIELMRLLMPGKAPMGDALRLAVEAARTGGLAPKAQEAMDAMARVVTAALSLDMENLSPEAAREAIRQSGLFAESIIKALASGEMTREDAKAALNSDIKAALGKALAEVEREIARIARDVESGRHFKENIEPLLEELSRARNAAKSLKDAINNIELNQLINTTVKKEGGQTSTAMYQLPFFSEGAVETARLYIKPKDEGGQKGEKRKKDESRIVFMLNMSRLGPVRVDVNVGEGKISGAVYVLDESVRNYVRERLPELLKPLEEAGYQAWFDVATADRKHVTEELENRIPVLAERGLISIKA